MGAAKLTEVLCSPKMYVNNADTRGAIDDPAFKVCIICQRCTNDQIPFLHTSEYSQNIFSQCSKFLRSITFWKTFQWSSLLSQPSLIVCVSCYSSAEKIFKMNKDLQKLRKSIKTYICAFTCEVIRYRTQNLNIKEEANQEDSELTRNATGADISENSSTMTTGEINISVKQEQLVVDSDYENNVEFGYSEAMEPCDLADLSCQSYSYNRVSELKDPPQLEDLIHTYTSSSGSQNTVLLRGFKIEIERIQVNRLKQLRCKSMKKNAKIKTVYEKKRNSGYVAAGQDCKTMYKCPVCEKTSDNFDDMKNHTTIHVSGSEDKTNANDDGENDKRQIVILKFYQCQVCLKTLNTRKSLHYHVQTHVNKDGLVCNICGSKLLNKDTFRQHLKLHSADGFQCQFCERICKTKTSLRRHTIMAHTKETPFECQLCPKKFKLKIELNKHIRRHEERRTRPYGCTFCPKTFTRPNHLKNHMKRHTGDQLICEYGSCCRKFDTKYLLDRHIKIHHTKEISFFCEVCGLSMKTKHSLDLHIRLHTGEKPYQCKICNKAFLRKQYRDEHTKTHTGETFQCTVCFRTILNKSNFKKHLRTHEKSLTNISTNNL